MLKRLLLTSVLLTSIHGADAELIADAGNPNTHNDGDVVIDRAEAHGCIVALLGKIQSTFRNPDISSEEVKQSILELSELSYINRFKIRDSGEGSFDSFNLSATFELKIPEIQSFVRMHAVTLLPQLMKMLADPIYSGSVNLFELFLLTAFSADFTPEILEVFMADSALSIIDTWLGSNNELKEFTILFLLCHLINTVQDPAHVVKLQGLSLVHLNIFLRSKNSSVFRLFKLASFDVDSTPQFIYELHQKLITNLCYPFFTPIVYGVLTSSIEEISFSSIEHEIAKKSAFMLILLKNYRNDFLNIIIETLDFVSKENEETILLAFPEIIESRYVRSGNPKFREQPTIPHDPKELENKVLNFLQSRT